MRPMSTDADGTPEITPAELHRALHDGEGLQLVDVRTRLEHRGGRIPGSLSSPIQTLRWKLDRLDLDRDRPVVAICKSAHRSIPAVRMLRARGFQAYQLAGGTDRWRREGFALDAVATQAGGRGDDVDARIRRRLVAASYDRFTTKLEVGLMRKVRSQLLSGLEGRVLEIGAGTGANLAHYPESVTHLDLVEVDPYMAETLRERMPERSQLHVGSAESLPYGDAEFTAVVSTLALCSIGDLDATLGEIRRVLQPGGKLVFVEHVRSGRPKWGLLQDRLTPTWRWLSVGCTANRDTMTLLEEAGFAVEETGSVEFGRRAFIRDFKWGHAVPGSEAHARQRPGRAPGAQ